MHKDRRSQSTLGRKRRREFDHSVHQLRALGMPDWAVEYYRRAARMAGLPPHMVVCHVAVVAAGRQLRTRLQELEIEAGVAPAQEEGVAPPSGAPSYESVKMMRRRVTDLWQEIERHANLLDVARAADAAAAESGDASPAGFPVDALVSEPDAATHRPARSRRKTSSKNH